MSSVDYGKIIKRSWHLTWKNKWLWVAGLVLATLGGGSSGSSGGGSSSNIDQSVPKEDLQNKATDVLGIATDYFQDWFSKISIGDWAFLILLIIATAVLGVIVVLVLKSWAKGALIKGIEDADEEKSVTLKSISPYGITNVKNLIIYSLISTGIFIALMVSLIVVFVFIVALLSLLQESGSVLIVLFMVLAVIALIISVVLLIMVSVYAERLIVLKNYSPWEAWKKGLSLSRGNFFPTLVMGIINSVIGLAVGCLGSLALLVVFAVPGVALVYPMFKNGFTMPSIPQVIGIIIMVVLFFAIITGFKAIYVVFNYGNWNLFFKEVMSKKEDKK